MLDAGASKSTRVMSPKVSMIALFTLATVLAQSAIAAGKSAEPTQMKRSVAQNIFNLDDLSTAVGACQDLNTFMNAKWVANHPIPPERTRWGSFSELTQKTLDEQHKILKQAATNTDQDSAETIESKVGRLYTSGMDTDAIDKAGYSPIKPRLGAIAGIHNRKDLKHYLTQAFASGQGQVFELYAGPDYKNAKRVIAYAYQSGLGLPAPKYYTDKAYADQRAAYVDYMTRLFKLTGESSKQATADAGKAMAFETKLAKHSLSHVAMRKPKNQYHFVSLAEANQATPNFDWKAFFAAQNADIKRGFSLSEPKFFNEFNKLLAKAPLDQWRDYLRFHAIDDAAPLLAKKFRTAHFHFHGTVLNGQPKQKDRWKQVLHAVNGAMGQALGQLYVAHYFPPQAKARAERLVSNIRNALKTRLQNNAWMSDTTRKKALAKLSKFLPKIGYPEHWRSWKGLSISSHDFYANMAAAAQFNHDYEMAYVGQPRDRYRWEMTPQTVNAYYSPTSNTINFPAAILQPPFFYPHGDDAVNYGGIGAVIGHEMNHGYDDQGSHFDGNGNQVNWWTPADRKAFKARTAKLVKQFDQYTPIPGKPDIHVNGQLTLGENIADLDGLTLAYDALQAALSQNSGKANKTIDGYTENQRFFMAWARVWRGHTRPKALEVQLNSDPHSPMAVRAIGAPSDMPAFAKAFNCSPKDTMVRPPDQRVDIW